MLAILRFRDEAEAIRIANDTSYGLQASVWSSHVDRAHRVARALRAGTVHVNQYDEDDITVPFGGFKQSGNGRDKSLHAFDKYTELKTTWLRINVWRAVGPQAPRPCRRTQRRAWPARTRGAGARRWEETDEPFIQRGTAGPQAAPRAARRRGDGGFAERAENALLWDVEGRRYIDFAGGIAVLNTGHRHPAVVAAIEAQLQRFTHTCWQVVPYEGYVALAEKLNALTPGTHAKKTALFSTGAEAVENAVKIARAHTGRSGVIAFGGAFHGRSLFAVALTGKVQPYKAGFGPFPPEIYHAPFPAEGTDLAEVQRAVQHLFKTDIDPTRVAAIVFEPVQGEGGFHVIRAEAVTWLRELCDAHGIVLIADEVQTGFGRTGRLFAMQHHEERSGVVADLLVSASRSPPACRCRRSPGAPRSWTPRRRAGWAAPMPATRSPWRRRTP